MTVPDTALVVGAGESLGAAHAFGCDARREGYSAFATGRFGLRALAQSAARELGRRGIHVAHVVIEGPIDTPFVRERFPERVRSRPADGLLEPDDIADTYWAIHRRKRSAWTFEADLRPWVEPLTTF